MTIHLHLEAYAALDTERAGWRTDERRVRWIQNKTNLGEKNCDILQYLDS